MVASAYAIIPYAGNRWKRYTSSCPHRSRNGLCESPRQRGLALLARYRHKRRWYLNDLLATALGTARLGRSMLGDALDALESLIAPHAAIPVGRHGSLPHEDEDCGSRIYANRQRLTCLQQRGVPKNRFSERLHARPSRTDGHERRERGRQPVPFEALTRSSQQPLAQSKRTASPVQGLYSRTLPEARKTAECSRSASSASLPPSKVPRRAKRQRETSRGAIVLPAVKGWVLAMPHPQNGSSLSNSWQDRQGGSKRSLHRCGLHGRGSGSQAGKVAAAISSAAPGGPHQPPQALLGLVQRHEA